MNSGHTNTEYRPSTVTPPGETLRELLDERGISQVELSERTGRPRKTINEILSGKTAITPETALQLELVLGVPASFWNVRETRYREFLARQQEEARLESISDWANQFPVAEMIRKGWLPKVTAPGQRAQAVLEFFGVASPDQWRNIYAREAVAFRKSTAFTVNELALAAWLRMGARIAERTAAAPYDEAKFRLALSEARDLTRQTPRAFIPTLARICREAGVVVVFVPELKGCRVHGATRWLSPKRALVQLSLRYRTDDHLWFTFFHEAAHILLHRKKTIFLEGLESSGTEEEEADRFASEHLVPSEELTKLNPRAFSKMFLVSLAADLGIAPGVLVGRLQHDRLLPFDRYNQLKQKLAWDTSSVYAAGTWTSEE